MRMRRREFITLLGGAAASWPLAASAQQPALPVIGFLALSTSNTFSAQEIVSFFLQGLENAGYVDGRNVAIDYRWAEFQDDRLRMSAADLVARRVAIIAALGNPAPAIVAKAATTTIPIVFAVAGDPVALGLVASLSRPGGNLTGVTSLNVEIAPKRLELLHELVPAGSGIALLLNPTSPFAESLSRDFQAAAHTLGLPFHVLNASSADEIDLAFTTMAQRRVAGLVIAPDAYFNSRLDRLAALALQHRIPAIYSRREFPAAGGLMSYGGGFTDAFRLAGVYAGRILKGEKPMDLPVQQASKVELFINLKTAKALGLTVPQTLLIAAEEVIE